MPTIADVDAVLTAAIVDGAFPGCSYAVGCGERLWCNALGSMRYDESPAVRLDSIFDLASVSKVVATTTVFMSLVDDRRIAVEMRVAEFLPEFGVNGKSRITFANLLRHDSGLIAFRRYQLTCDDADQVWSAIANESLDYETGSKTVYSDLSMIVVQKAIERIEGRSLACVVRDRVTAPLGMVDTGYSPGIDSPRCVPTEAFEDWRRRLRKLRGQPGADAPFTCGEVHDPTAAAMGGVAGHAGLFSTVLDLARFARMMVREGDGLIAPETVRRFTTRQTDQSTRGLGWDTKSPEGSSAGARFGPRSFGHTGYTGTSMWIDPDAGVFAILLTNRVHPTSENLKIADVRPRFHDAVWDAIFGA